MYTGLPTKDKTLVFCLTLNDTNTNVVYKIRDWLTSLPLQEPSKKEKIFCTVVCKISCFVDNMYFG